jgi:hypothetical protein
MTTMCGSGASCLREMRRHRLKIAMHNHLGTDLGLARSQARGARAAESGALPPGLPSRRQPAGRKGRLAARAGRMAARRGRMAARRERITARAGRMTARRERMAAGRRRLTTRKGAMSARMRTRCRPALNARWPAPAGRNVRSLLPATSLITSSLPRVIERLLMVTCPLILAGRGQLRQNSQAHPQTVPRLMPDRPGRRQ